MNGIHFNFSQFGSACAGGASHRQAGVLTIFMAVLVLVLMTLMLFYTTRVGLFEQRVAANDLRQKLAFQAAEAGIDYALEFLLANNERLISNSDQAAPFLNEDGDLDYYAGWFAEGSTFWAACPDSPPATHPCGGEIASGEAGSFYYDDPSTTTEGAYDALPLDDTLLGNLPAGTEVRVTAILCSRDPEITGPNEPCDGPAGMDLNAPESPTAQFTTWVLAYGYSDCNDNDRSGAIDLPGECSGRAAVSRPLGSLDNFKGSPNVPLVSKNAIRGQGTFDVVPNPNGGGVGVPLSTWVNNRIGADEECPTLAPGGGSPATDGQTIQGDFTTCEMHEWYSIDYRPDDHACPPSTVCTCSRQQGEAISYVDQSASPPQVFGIDILKDPVFPCDLFEFYFGYPSDEYQAVKASATIIDDCGALNEASEGFFWFSGDTCNITNNVGTVNNPIILVSAAETRTKFTGCNNFYGILYVADVEDTGAVAEFQSGGCSSIFGALIVDVPWNNSASGGNFSVVYDEAALMGAGGAGGIGRVAGGWHDFGLPQITWEP